MKKQKMTFHRIMSLVLVLVFAATFIPAAIAVNIPDTEAVCGDGKTDVKEQTLKNHDTVSVVEDAIKAQTPFLAQLEKYAQYTNDDAKGRATFDLTLKVTGNETKPQPCPVFTVFVADISGSMSRNYIKIANDTKAGTDYDKFVKNTGGVNPLGLTLGHAESTDYKTGAANGYYHYTRIMQVQNSIYKAADAILGSSSANRVALASYSTYAKIDSNFTNNLGTFKTALTGNSFNNIKGYTNHEAGLAAAYQIIDNAYNAKAIPANAEISIIFMSDGRSTSYTQNKEASVITSRTSLNAANFTIGNNDSRDEAKGIAAAVKAAGFIKDKSLTPKITIYGISVGADDTRPVNGDVDKPDTELIKSISDYSYESTAGIDSVINIYNDIANTISNPTIKSGTIADTISQYFNITGFESATIKTTDWLKEINVGGKTYKADAAGNYMSGTLDYLKAFKDAKLPTVVKNSETGLYEVKWDIPIALGKDNSASLTINVTAKDSASCNGPEGTHFYPPTNDKATFTFDNDYRQINKSGAPLYIGTFKVPTVHIPVQKTFTKLTIAKGTGMAGTFPFTVVFGKALPADITTTPAATPSADRKTWTFNLAAGGSIVFGKLPHGTTYTVTESTSPTMAWGVPSIVIAPTASGNTTSGYEAKGTCAAAETGTTVTYTNNAGIGIGITKDVYTVNTEAPKTIPPNVVANDVVWYIITVTNTSKDFPLTNVVVKDGLTGAEGPFSTADSDNAYKMTGPFTIAASGSLDLYYKYVVPADAKAGIINNVATAQGDNTDEVDDDADINVQTPNISIVKEVYIGSGDISADANWVDANTADSAPVFEDGESVQFRIKVKNSGAGIANGLKLADVMTGVAGTFKDLTPAAGNPNPDKFSLDAGETKFFYYSATVVGLGQDLNAELAVLKADHETALTEETAIVAAAEKALTDAQAAYDAAIKAKQDSINAGSFDLASYQNETNTARDALAAAEVALTAEINATEPAPTVDSIKAAATAYTEKLAAFQAALQAQIDAMTAAGYTFPADPDLSVIPAAELLLTDALDVLDIEAEGSLTALADLITGVNDAIAAAEAEVAQGTAPSADDTDLDKAIADAQTALEAAQTALITAQLMPKTQAAIDALNAFYDNGPAATTLTNTATVTDGGHYLPATGESDIALAKVNPKPVTGLTVAKYVSVAGKNDWKKVESFAFNNNGYTVDWKIVVKNIGNQKISGISLTDKVNGSEDLALTGTLNAASFDLNPQASAEFFYNNYTFTSNNAGATIKANTATATYSDGGAEKTAQSSAFAYAPKAPKAILAIDKTVQDPSDSDSWVNGAGVTQDAPYTFIFKITYYNIGNATAVVDVTDSFEGQTLDLYASIDLSGSAVTELTLNPGDVKDLYCAKEVTSDGKTHVNTATVKVKGDDEGGIEDKATVTVNPIPKAALTVGKTWNHTVDGVAQNVSAYKATFVVKNSDGVEVTGSPIEIIGNGTATIQGLIIGETYTVTETPIPAGFTCNPAGGAHTISIGTSENVVAFTNSKSENIVPPPTNDPLVNVTIKKEVKGTDGAWYDVSTTLGNAAERNVDYRVTIKSEIVRDVTGNYTITGVMTDDKLPGQSFPYELNAGNGYTFVREYTMLVPAGTTHNTAFTGDPRPGPDSNFRVTAQTSDDATVSFSNPGGTPIIDRGGPTRTTPPSTPVVIVSNPSVPMASAPAPAPVVPDPVVAPEPVEVFEEVAPPLAAPEIEEIAPQQLPKAGGMNILMFGIAGLALMGAGFFMAVDRKRSKAK